MSVEVTAEAVRRLLADQFPAWARLPLEPVVPGGWDNRTFRLGTDMSVRVPSAPRYAAKVEIEQRWLPRLAPGLPLPIPEPLALGRPGEGIPWPWSIYGWLEGEDAVAAGVDPAAVATDLGHFLAALHRVDAAGGPPPGAHNFHRGASLRHYEQETVAALEVLSGTLDLAAARRAWRVARESEWEEAPVWVHGDIAPGNLLVRKGRLGGVIDFGGLGVGDPACDLAIAWSWFEGEGRSAFRAALPLGRATWDRARGWALWKALILLAGIAESTPRAMRRARHVLDQVLADSPG